MQPPDQRLFAADLLSAEFRAGVAKRLWGEAETETLPDSLAWPKAIFWIGAASRDKAPERFYFLLDLVGYRAVPPTGTLWDPDAKSVLDHARRPKGKPDSRFARVFRTDWNNGSAFYHPYDRVAAGSHPGWATEQPHLIWTSARTIADYLEEFHCLLNSG